MSKRTSSVLWAALALVWLAALAVRPLYKPDEARYGEIPREMVASGDWLTPRLNGFKYFEKPPLQYWMTALAFKVFGVNDWSARLWAGLAALAGVGVVFGAADRLFSPPAGAYAAAIVASCPLYLLLGQVNTLDMGVTLFLSAAAFAFALAQRPGATVGERLHWMLAFWAACAAAVLTKGLIGIVLPLGTIALYTIGRRDWGLLRRLELARGGLLFLVLAAPWFVAVSLANPEFAYFFFVQEHWLRFTTHIHHHQRPPWFFLPVLALGVWPWLLALVAGWAAALRPPATREFSPAFFLGLWIVVVFGFFSASGSKLPPYILPLVPALAVLGGAFLSEKPRRRLLFAQGLFAAGVAVAIGGVAWYVGTLPDDAYYGLGSGYSPWLAAAAAIALAGAAAGAVLAWRARVRAAVASLAIGAAAALMIGMAGHVVLAPAYSAAPLIASLPRPPSAQAAVFTVDAYDHSIPWSLGRTVTMVRYKDELERATVWEPDKFIPDAAAFARAWTSEREAYAFFAVRDFDRLRRELDVPMTVVARGPRYVIVRKP
ncbi:MAG TPA: glycosyltransferase family 39 protein [Burkholderiales bacterium]|nr:glycosyltransferase family 39 protein [Burkholderiales bacterium]